VSDADIPHSSDELEALVDDLVVDVGLADLDRVVEELPGDQVLELGGDLTTPYGVGVASP
jgi:hypothetical protein